MVTANRDSGGSISQAHRARGRPFSSSIRACSPSSKSPATRRASTLTVGDEIDTLAFTADGAALYAVGPDVLLQRHPIAPDDVVRVLCERFGGGLTRAQ
ncbi:hypothetical protein ACIPSJ_26645 [Streptomyces sp. NPDC090088]|uniref:hypothetical protein n=1 Tax=Streptomyces sp. NPDC090088 TaxID=3365944 RepID=UPI0037F17FA1